MMFYMLALAGVAFLVFTQGPGLDWLTGKIVEHPVPVRADKTLLEVRARLDNLDQRVDQIAA